MCLMSHNVFIHCKGFAFVEYEDPRDAEDAVKDMDGQRVCGMTIRCELAKNTSRCSMRL